MAGPERQDKTRTPFYRARFFSRVSFNTIHANKVRNPVNVFIELDLVQARRESGHERSVIRRTRRLANQTNRRI